MVHLEVVKHMALGSLVGFLLLFEHLILIVLLLLLANGSNWIIVTHNTKLCMVGQ